MKRFLLTVSLIFVGTFFVVAMHDEVPVMQGTKQPDIFIDRHNNNIVGKSLFNVDQPNLQEIRNKVANNIKLKSDEIRKVIQHELGVQSPDYDVLQDLLKTNKFQSNEGFGRQVALHNDYMDQLTYHVDRVRTAKDGVVQDRSLDVVDQKNVNVSESGTRSMPQNSDDQQRLQDRIQILQNEVSGFRRLSSEQQEKFVNFIDTVLDATKKHFTQEPLFNLSTNRGVEALREAIESNSRDLQGLDAETIQFLQDQARYSRYKKILLAVGVTSIVVAGLISVILDVELHKKGKVIVQRDKKDTTVSKKETKSKKDSTDLVHVKSKQNKALHKNRAVKTTELHQQANMKKNFDKVQKGKASHYSVIAPTGITTGFMHMSSAYA